MQRDYSSPEESLNFKFPALIYVRSTNFSPSACSPVQEEKTLTSPATAVGQDMIWSHPWWMCAHMWIATAQDWSEGGLVIPAQDGDQQDNQALIQDLNFMFTCQLWF